jgi:hypothetical protein
MVLIIGGRSFIYFTKSKHPTTDTWGTPHFIAPQFDKEYFAYNSWYYFDLLFSVRQHLRQLAAIP